MEYFSLVDDHFKGKCRFIQEKCRFMEEKCRFIEEKDENSLCIHFLIFETDGVSCFCDNFCDLDGSKKEYKIIKLELGYAGGKGEFSSKKEISTLKNHFSACLYCPFYVCGSVCLENGKLL